MHNGMNSTNITNLTIHLIMQKLLTMNGNVCSKPEPIQDVASLIAISQASGNQAMNEHRIAGSGFVHVMVH